VYGIFRTIGYPPAVAHMLTALCTNTIPARVWAATPRPREPRLVQAHFWLGPSACDTPPSSGRSDLPRPRQPRRVQTRPPPDRPQRPLEPPVLQICR
jgi:hypothetical protein